MATSQIASMLDELMGRNRNFAPDDANARELKWSDPEVCRYYIVQFCPHDLFTNTKADLGPCAKIHDDELRRKFSEEKESYKKSQYLDDFLRFCQRALSDLQTRIKKAKERLLLTQQAEENKLNAGGQGVSGGQNKEIDEKIILLSEKISALVAEAEQAGCRGNVEEAQGLMKLCDQLREERDTLRRTVAPSQYKDDYGQQQKAMEVCDICGAFLIVGDAQQRIDDHLLGKQHVGYARLRAAVDKILEERRKFREEREKEVEERRRQKDEEMRKEVEDRRKKREEERKERGGAGNEERKERGGNEERKERGNNEERKERGNEERKERGDSRRKSRSRSRERRRSRDRDSNKRRGGGGDRDRRGRDDRDRNRDRDARRRSRSRDRKRDRDRERSRRSRSRDKRSSRRSTRDSRSKSRDRDRERRKNNSSPPPPKESRKEDSNNDSSPRRSAEQEPSPPTAPVAVETVAAVGQEDDLVHEASETTVQNQD